MYIDNKTNEENEMAKYKEAVQWIADNDEPTVTNPKDIENFITSALVADIFHKELKEVALDVSGFRQKENRK